MSEKVNIQTKKYVVGPSIPVVKGVAKILKLNASEGITDGNTVQLPCIAEYKGQRITLIEYTWKQKINGKSFYRGIEVSGHGKYGVPTLRELDILLALQRIFIKRKTINGIVELKTENISDEDLTIDFTINELAKELGYASPNGRVRANLKKSIRILVSTTITNLYEGGIYDIRIKKYITDTNFSFHYIEAVSGYKTEFFNEHEIIENKDNDMVEPDENLGSQESFFSEDEVAVTNENVGEMALTKSNKNNIVIINGKKNLIDVTKIRVSSFFYQMIINDYKRYYNIDKYRQTKNLIARKIYLLALQWKNKKPYSFASYNTLIEKVPMKEDLDNKYRKLYIKRALDELNKKEILKVVYPTRKTKANEDLSEGDIKHHKKDSRIFFIFDPNLTVEDIIKMESSETYSSELDVKNGMRKYGLSEDQINEYFSYDKYEDLQAILRMCDVKLYYNAIDHPLEYFISCISGNIKPPDKYYNKLK